jgi:hypothetical protein
VTDEEEIERLILAYSPKFQQMVKLAEQQIRAGEVQTHDEFWQEVLGESV